MRVGESAVWSANWNNLEGMHLEELPAFPTQVSCYCLLTAVYLKNAHYFIIIILLLHYYYTRSNVILIIIKRSRGDLAGRTIFSYL